MTSEQISEEIAKIEQDRDKFAIALYRIILADTALRREAMDYAAHPQFESMREATDAALTVLRGTMPPAVIAYAKELRATQN